MAMAQVLPFLRALARLRRSMNVHSSKGFKPTTAALSRLFVAAAGAAALALAVYRAPVWLSKWNAALAVGAIGCAVIVLVVAVAIALRGHARTVQRIATEILFLGSTLVAVEALLVASAPEGWSDSAVIQRLRIQAHAAAAHRLPYDERLVTEVVGELRARGVDAVPGFGPSSATNEAVASAVRDRGLLPLSNVSNAHVVECNEGTGYLEFRSDEFGFNNPPRVASSMVDVAVIGESLAVGHCVAPADSVVGIVRSRFPRTANFGVAGSKVLSQLGVFREFVTPLEPPVLVWFVNPGYAEPGDETQQPILMNYLTDPSFSQRLRKRQVEVDSFVRDIMIPLALRRDDVLRVELESSRSFPFLDLLKLRQVRSLIEPERSASKSTNPRPNLADFKQAVALVTNETRSWGGRVIVVIAPSNEVSTRPENVARYNSVVDALAGADVDVVDGPALFAAAPNARGLYTLGIDNHPSERGHALLADSLLAAIERVENTWKRNK